MNLRIGNQLNMACACINVAQSNDYKSVWFEQEPADFGTDIAELQSKYTAVINKASLADAATGGGGDTKSAAETALEDAAFVLTRALANHFKKTGDLDRHGKVDFTKTEIVKLRAQDLLNQATAIRDLANAALLEPGATGRGVTAARIGALSSAITAFNKVIGTPRSQIVNRSTLLKEVETDTAEIVELLKDMDDLVLQFDGTDAGKRFIEAWKRARMIMDIGGGHSADDAATPPTPSA